MLTGTVIVTAVIVGSFHRTVAPHDRLVFK